MKKQYLSSLLYIKKSLLSFSVLIRIGILKTRCTNCKYRQLKKGKVRDNLNKEHLTQSNICTKELKLNSSKMLGFNFEN